MGNPVGRPTKYNDDLQAQADRYVYEWKDIGDVVPSRVGLCCYLGVGKQTTYVWEEKYPRFRDTLAAVDALQEHVALNRGINNEFNSTIVKLVLANHGYSDKQAVDHSSKDGSMSPRPALDASKLSGAALRELMDARNTESD